MSDESVDELILQLERLRIEQAIVIQRLPIARERETGRDTQNREPQTITINVGDQVRINNNVRLASGIVSENDRRAIVTRTTASRVYFRTVNGRVTWRARTNLTRGWPN